MHDTLRHHKVTFYHGDGSPMLAYKIRPNDPCPCGSGKKSKHCCGAGTKYYSSKPRDNE